MPQLSAPSLRTRRPPRGPRPNWSLRFLGLRLADTGSTDVPLALLTALRDRLAGLPGSTSARVRADGSVAVWARFAASESSRPFEAAAKGALGSLGLAARVTSVNAMRHVNPEDVGVWTVGPVFLPRLRARVPEEIRE